MMGTENNADLPHQKTQLVQTKLTSAFFGCRRGHACRSPYLFRASVDTAQIESILTTLEGPKPLKPIADAPRWIFTSTVAPTSMPSPSPKHNDKLAGVAAETKALLPHVLELVPNARPKGDLYDQSNLFPLNPHSCPKLPSTKIRVLNADSIDAALSISPRTSASFSAPSSKPVLVLNMANAYHSGGGWEQGALAQEEALCYRSSLAFTLKTRYYPIPEAGGIYSPTVVVIRESIAQGHNLLDLSRPHDLPVVSCISVAAIRKPDLVRDVEGREKYKGKLDRETMKEKMRVVLRVAAVRKHRVLVLAALGCGAFSNPREEVVQCWKEVFGESEFGGGWWETVVFAVLELGEHEDGDGNFGVFFRGLDGVKV